MRNSFCPQDKRKKAGMVVRAYKPGTQEAESGGSKVAGQPGLHSETLSTKRKERREEGRDGEVRE
jgi:hypothetical protein